MSLLSGHLQLQDWMLLATLWLQPNRLGSSVVFSLLALPFLGALGWLSMTAKRGFEGNAFATYKAMRVRLKYGLAFWLNRGGRLGPMKWLLRDLSYYGWLYVTPHGWRERRFDSTFGVRTGEIIPLSKLTITSPNLAYGVQHAPTRPRVLRSALRRLPLDYRQFAFVDLGCGKGRALLVASEFPFKKIVGVEFAAELVSAARDNVAHYRNPNAQCQEIVLFHMDACEYQIPEGKAVVYFFNPFGEPVMRKVLANLRSSLRAHPREMYLVYFIPTQARLMDELEEFEPVYSVEDLCVYRSKLPQGCATAEEAGSGVRASR